MKLLVYKLVLPLTIITLFGVTKWWIVAADGPNTKCIGFPFPYMCDGWHTSMSNQIFLAEFIADIIIYFLFWFIVIYCINRFANQIKPGKMATIPLWLFSFFILYMAYLAFSNPDNLYYLTRDFDMTVLDSGLWFFTLK